jgi:uncharacterized protein YutE (UPF0331/DUF86 family)
MIVDKLKRLEENLRVLTSFKKKYSLDDVKADKVDEWGLRYGLLESIQIIIDLACSYVSEKNLGMPENYSDCIALLISNKYLDKNLGKRLIRMVGLRNLLVHEYGIIDVQKLYDYLNHLEDVRDFAVAISK